MELKDTTPYRPPPRTDKQHKLVKRATVCNLDPKQGSMKYAVRGEVVTKQNEMKARLAKGEKLPFDRIVPCNIGNPHAVMQKPITFYRQIAACVNYPQMMEGEMGKLLPKDVIERAKEYLDGTGGNGVGAYTDSAGLMLVREQVAAYIKARDGYDCNVADLELTTGASEGVKRCLSALIADSDDAVMISCPQYPLYSASLAMFGGQAQYYYLEEESGWTVTRAELERAHGEAEAKGWNVRAIAVINPGNPSGAVLSLEDVKMICDFAREKQIVILADEVYQRNVYAEGKEFHSFKKVLRMQQDAHPVDKQDKDFSQCQLISFHSTSKGLIGECGQRGGYSEFINFSKQTMDLFTKIAATSLSSNTLGQIFVGLMCAPPKEGGASFELFKKEEGAIYDGMRRRAMKLEQGLNAIRGLSCQPIAGAMYAFARLDFDADVMGSATAEAESQGRTVDEMWCLELVEKCGIVCVPGSGFGQREGTHHFRITILPPDDMMDDMLKRLGAFQEEFNKRHGSS